MPSTITGIYDSSVSVITGALPSSYVRLPNPYFLDKNTFLHMMTDSFGLTVDPGTNTKRFLDCGLVTWQQSYTIVLVKRVTLTQNDTSGRVSLEKELLTDFQSVWKAFETNPSLTGTVIDASVQGHGGINFVDTERLKFLAMFISLVVEYQDTIP